MREMKESGIEWVGQMPSDWELVKIATLYSIRNTKVSDIDYPPLSVTMQGILPQVETAAKTNDHDNRKLVKKGDFAINSRSDRRGSCGISEYDGSVSLINTVLKPNRMMNSRYYNWLFHTPLFADEFYKWGHGIVDDLWTTGWQEMKKITVPFPTAIVQEKIADFLDAKCAEIDALTADIEKQIETLEQYKRSVITEAVTKGLNPDVEMKESRIDGYDNIPFSWDVSRLSYECYIRARLGWRGLKADEYVDEGYSFISAFNIQNGQLVWSPLNYITKQRYDESPEIKIRIGDVLIVKDGAGVGKCARVDNLPMGETAPNSSIAVITPNARCNYRFVCYYLQSTVFENFVFLLYNGMGVPHLTQEVMNRIKIPIPSLKEQIAISDFLDGKCSSVNISIQEKQEQLEKLANYKKSLIYEYVTGKKEVV